MRNKCLAIKNNNSKSFPSTSIPIPIPPKMKRNRQQHVHDDDDDVRINFNKAKSLCMRCNISEGLLLPCAVSTCPLSFHPQCAPPRYDSDDDGAFYCPHCAYSRYLSLSDLALQSVRSTKQQLSHFLTTTTTNNDVPPPVIKPHNDANQDYVPPPPTVFEPHNDANQDDAPPTVFEPHNDANQDDAPPPVFEPHSDASQDDHTANEDAVASDDDYLASAAAKGKGKRLRNLPSSVANCTISKTRKVRRLLWSSQEEEMLKEGISKFASDDKSIPWKQILEFGRHIFHPSRNPESLRNKWKNNLAKDCSPLANM